MNMTAFNSVSVAINKLVNDRVVALLKSSAKSGMLLQFTGATEITSENMNLDTVRIIPVFINLTDGNAK